jgi:methionine-rich copper-binding protein CopC
MITPAIYRAAGAAVFLGLAITSLTQPAAADALLQQARPAVGGSVSSAPSTIELHFSEGVEVRYSQVSVTGPDGTVPVSRPVNGGAKTVLVVQVNQQLKPGRYRVHWSVLSVDTHKTQGSFSFQVQP